MQRDGARRGAQQPRVPAPELGERRPPDVVPRRGPALLPEIQTLRDPRSRPDRQRSERAAVEVSGVAEDGKLRPVVSSGRRGRDGGHCGQYNPRRGADSTPVGRRVFSSMHGEHSSLPTARTYRGSWLALVANARRARGGSSATGPGSPGDGLGVPAAELVAARAVPAPSRSRLSAVADVHRVCRRGSRSAGR